MKALLERADDSPGYWATIAVVSTCSTVLAVQAGVWWLAAVNAFTLGAGLTGLVARVTR